MTTDTALVLVVDDEPFNVDVLEQELELLGYATIAACNGREALERLAQRSVDLVLLDAMMPELDGFGVLARMHDHQTWRHVPVVMISAMTDMASVVRGIALGAQDYLPKPFEPVLLKARIESCLERKRRHDQEQTHLAEIRRQRDRADQLLHAILPAPAVAELTATSRVAPRRIDNVTVFMSDIVGFTGFCDGQPPDLVIPNLQALALAFEDIADHHGLERIGIVGDAFLAAASLFTPHANPVGAAVAAARELIAAGRTLPAPWEVRVGIACGPVMAGLIGRSKLRFDLWGDTVNTAARLASAGEVATILLSAAARALADGQLDLVPAGPIELKGKGHAMVWRAAV
jgi:DNA-binding response OmpR family regulator